MDILYCQYTNVNINFQLIQYWNKVEYKNNIDIIDNIWRFNDFDIYNYDLYNWSKRWIIEVIGKMLAE